MLLSLALGVIYFTLYSFFGWIYEILFHAVIHRKLHFQGFLALPLLPIYGFGAVSILTITYPYANNPIMVFISAVLVATVLELITSTFLLKVFNVRLWDYTNWPLNYKGKVGVISSLGFGVLGLLLLYVFQPIMNHLVSFIPAAYIGVTASFLFVIILLDFIYSTRSLSTLNLHSSAAKSSVYLSAQEIHKRNTKRIKAIFN